MTVPTMMLILVTMALFSTSNTHTINIQLDIQTQVCMENRYLQTIKYQHIEAQHQGNSLTICNAAQTAPPPRPIIHTIHPQCMLFDIKFLNNTLHYQDVRSWDHQNNKTVEMCGYSKVGFISLIRMIKNPKQAGAELFKAQPSLSQLRTSPGFVLSW